MIMRSDSNVQKQSPQCKHNMRVSVLGKGALQGTTLLDPVTKSPQCHRFSRVPYAVPPTGATRWKRPEPLPSTYSFGSVHKPGQYSRPSIPCPQIDRLGALSSSENCLHLNIWVPIGQSPDKGWPVFFYMRKYFPCTVERHRNNWIHRRGVFTIWVK